jgi:predicted flap endonuclease-1-like 5' DNA nuclease
MANNDGGLFSCRNTCWIVGGLLGLVVLLLINSPWIVAILVGLVVAVAVALILQRLFCSDVPASSGMAPNAPASAAATSTTEPAAAAASSAGTGDMDAAAAKPAPAEEASAKAQAAEDAPGTETVADETAAPAAAQEAEPSPDPIIKPSTALPGQRELEAKKGDWKYEKEPAAKPAAKTKTAKTSKAETAKPAAAPVAAGEGPELLDGPKGGVADDLKLIKGVGPGIEKKLHDAGVYHYDQIAQWTDADIAVMDDKLSFRGRIKRDDWITQARQLASGEQTEFSKRASSSGLYDENKKK